MFLWPDKFYSALSFMNFISTVIIYLCPFLLVSRFHSRKKVKGYIKYYKLSIEIVFGPVF